MKAILTNWRYYVISILFAVGMFATAYPFGDPVCPMSDGEWFAQAFISFAVGAGCFFTLYFCIVYWEHKGQIPEITNHKIY